MKKDVILYDTSVNTFCWFQGWNDMPRTCRSQKDSALHLAVQANNLDIIKLLLNEGVDVNSQNSLQVTPLMLCCQYNSHDIVHYLIQR